MVMTITPPDLAITSRDLRLNRGVPLSRWWLDRNPYSSAFYNALSITFPKGEAFFIESVRAFRRLVMRSVPSSRRWGGSI